MANKMYQIAFSTPSPVQTSELHAIIGKFLEGYSLQTAEGAWQGTIEHSYIVGVVSREGDNTIIDLAESLRDTYEQQCVLVTSSDVDVDFI